MAFLLFCYFSGGIFCREKLERRGTCSLAGRRNGVHSGDLPTPNTWSKHRREKTFSLGSNGCEHPRNQLSDQAKFLGGTFPGLDVFSLFGRGFSIQEELCGSLVGTFFIVVFS